MALGSSSASNSGLFAGDAGEKRCTKIGSMREVKGGGDDGREVRLDGGLGDRARGEG